MKIKKKTLFELPQWPIRKVGSPLVQIYHRPIGQLFLALAPQLGQKRSCGFGGFGGLGSGSDGIWRPGTLRSFRGGQMERAEFGCH